MSKLSDQLTVLIITHQRIDELRTTYERINRLGFPVVIAESSTNDTDLSPMNFGVAKIVRCRGGFEVFPLKIQEALSQVDTPYVVLSPDDDALDGDTLSGCLELMMADFGVAACQGNYVNIVIDGRFALPLPSWGNIPARSSRPEDLSTSAGSMFYAVQRTAILKTFFDHVADSEIANLKGSPGLVDSLLTTYLSLVGKVVILEDAYLFRTKLPGDAHSSTGDRKTLECCMNMTQFVDNFIRLCDNFRPIDVISKNFICSHIENLLESMMIFDQNLLKKRRIFSIARKSAFIRKSFWLIKFLFALTKPVDRRIIRQSFKSDDFLDLCSAVISSRSQKSLS